MKQLEVKSNYKKEMTLEQELMYNIGNAFIEFAKSNHLNFSQKNNKEELAETWKKQLYM